jgi:hypothetical protein
MVANSAPRLPVGVVSINEKNIVPRERADRGHSSSSRNTYRI